MSARQRTRKGPPRPGRTQTPDSAHSTKPSQALVEAWRELPDEQKGRNLSELVQQLPAVQKSKLMATVTQQRITEYTFSGPIPDPGSLAEYAKTDPNLPSQIVFMAEKEQDANKEIRLALVSNDTERIRGTTRVAAIAVIGICVPVAIATWSGHAWIALMLGIPVVLKGLLRPALDRLMPRNDGAQT